MKKKGDRVFLVYKQTDITTSYVVRAFREEADADKFCKDQNELNWHEFDDWGYCEGVYHTYVAMKVE